MTLLGRQAECVALDGILADARAGRSRVAVLRGDAGAGKSALLDYVSERAVDCHVATATGVESEMELAYSGLHQLCAPMLDRIDGLPVPQRAALRTVFGQSAGPPPDRFLVGLATLTLLAEVAEQDPLVCIVDDAHWLDDASAQILAFVARRLLAERIAIVCAARRGIGDAFFVGLPELSVDGLDDSNARALLLENVQGPLDAAVCEQIVTESHGNPLALLELPRTWDAAELAGGFGVPASHAVTNKIEQSYAKRLLLLPAETQLLVLTAAAEPLGDPLVLHHAAGALGLTLADASAAADAGLLEVGARIEFTHPLVRSAVYGSAGDDERRRVHHALADATDPEREPDRRAWHRARATPGPDEEVAAELERSADRAQSRGGVVAAAAFLRRAVALTVDPERRANRALAAAEAHLQAGAFDAALADVSIAESGPPDELRRARIHLLRGRIASASSYGSAASELLSAAKELEPLDVELARDTYLEAWGTALAAGEVRDVSRAAAAAPRPRDPRPSDVLLDGLALLVRDGLEAAAPALREAVSAFRTDASVLLWGAMAASAAAALWDLDGFDAVITQQLQLSRDAGALALRATALQGAGIVVTWQGTFDEAASLVAEADEVTGATGIRISPFGGMLLAAYRGIEADAVNLLDQAAANAEAGGEGLGVQYACWATAVLSNGLGLYDDALAAARRANETTPELFVADWALVELVEAASRTGDARLAAEAAARLVDKTRATGSDWALGLAARSQALASDAAAAEPLYAEAVARLGRTRVRPELARTHLLFGEWLRREGRRVDAREQLRKAHDMLAAMGMEAFAERARRELVATGEKARKRTADTLADLTPQEAQIAQLAREGLSNPEIGTQLFLSPRTVEWHLRKVFGKLDISSRKELDGALRTRREVPVA